MMKIHLLKGIIDSYKGFIDQIFNQDFLSRRQQNLSLGIIIVFIFIIRICSIQNPAIDRTAWKEIDYITISKNYVNNGFHFFEPTIDWPAEAPRVTAMEFPLVPYLAAVLYKIFGFNVYTVRIITLLAFLVIIFFVFKLVKKELGPMPAILSALMAGIMPLHSPFPNFLFSEPSMIAFSVFAIYYFSKWLDAYQTRYFFLSVFGFTMAILLKLEPLYLMVIFFGLFFYKNRFNYLEYKRLIAFGALSIILPICWYGYAYYLTYNSIDVFGIFRGHNKFQSITMLTTPHWYKLMFYSLEHLSGGFYGGVLFLLGFTSLLLTRKGLMIFLYLAAITFYFIIVAEGNIDGPYRQLVAVPSFSIFIAVGALSLMFPLSLFFSKTKINQPANYLIMTILVILVIQFKNFHFDRSTSKIPFNTDEWQLSGIVKQFSTNNSKLVLLGGYTVHKGGNDLSPVLYYYSDLQGWTLQKKDWALSMVNKYQSKGADLLVGYNLDREPGLQEFVDGLKKSYLTLYESNEKKWIILSLNTKNSTFIKKE